VKKIQHGTSAVTGMMAKFNSINVLLSGVVFLQDLAWSK